MTSEIIKELINSNMNKVTNMQENYNLYKGKHDILKKTRSSAYKPNNKIINRYFKYIVDYPASYFLGIPATIQHNKSDKIQNVMNEIFADNNLDDLLYEACKESDIKGCSYLLAYQNEKGQTKIIRVPAEEMIVERNRLTNEIELAIRYYKVYNVAKKRDYIFVEVYTAQDVSYFVEGDDGDYYLDTEVQINPAPHNYSMVPVIKIVSNEEEESIIEVIKNLVTDYDKVFSDESDMLELFKNLKMIYKNCSAIPLKDDGTIDEEKMAIMLGNDIIEIESLEGSDADVKYLTREVNTEATEKHLDRLNKNIHKFAYVPDLSDEEFGQNLSGVSIKFKYAGLDIRVGEKERKLRVALAELLKILTFPILIKTGEALKLTDIDVKFARNIPQNDKENTEVVVSKASLGLYDDETLLAMLGEKDPMAILNKKKAEDKEKMGAEYTDFHNIVAEETE